MKDSSGAIKVVIAWDFSDEIIEQLREISPQLHIERHFPNVPESAWADAEILYTARKLPNPAQAPRLRWIQFHSAGLDGVMDEPIVKAEDVEVTSASGIHASHMAEFCIAMILAFEFKLPKMLDLQAKAEWPQERANMFQPRGLRGQTLGIAGYGSIGRELARIADHMGMTVLATKRNLMQLTDENEYNESGLGDPTADIPARIYPNEALASMVSLCDYVVITLPLTPKTRHMVNEQVLKSMKPSAVLINVGRGGVIDEAALISALAAKTIAGAGLDVFEEEPLPGTSPLWNLDNLIISPHVSGNSARYYEKAAALFAENLQRYIENRPLLNRLDRQRGY
jgi:phosphoglycerate dehydrogenase-like enzyme